MANKKFYLSEMHLFQRNNAFFVFMPCNLLFFEVDHESYKNLCGLQKEFGCHRPLEAFDSEYLDAGLVYEADEPIQDELRTHFESLPATMDGSAFSAPITSAVLQIANDCNLNCIYCYGDGGSYGRKRELMSLETAKHAVDFMVKNSKDIKELYVVFFGGEPLINFEVVKETFNYCKNIEKKNDKKFRFSMTTNGTILNDEIFHFIKDNKISVMISVDGGKEVQNKHRCYCDGRGSFDDVQKNIARFKETRGGFLTARATVCSTDIRFKQIKDDLLDMGFTNVVTSMVDTAEDSPLFIGGDYTQRVLEQYGILADDYVEKIMSHSSNGHSLFSELLDKVYFKKMKIRGCNAGTNGIAVGTDGNIYPCHRFMGMPDYIIGSLENGIDNEACNRYREATVLTKDGCKDCWARYICSGGCAHTSVVHGGDVYHAPSCYCDIYRGLYEIVLYTYWRLKEWDDNYFRKTLEKADKLMHTLPPQE